MRYSLYEQRNKINRGRHNGLIRIIRLGRCGVFMTCMAFCVCDKCVRVLSLSPRCKYCGDECDSVANCVCMLCRDDDADECLPNESEEGYDNE